MKKRTLLIAGILLVQGVMAQPLWTVDRCIGYALQHNSNVRQRLLQLDNARAEHLRSRAAFLPNVHAGTSAQYSFGRAVDPETNTYTTVNTFSNGYSLSASLSVFDGFARLHELRAAKARVLIGKRGVEAQQDEVAQQVMKCYMEVLFSRGAVKLAADKRRASELLLHRTRVMQEIGTKNAADVAQLEAVFAADDYEVTRQEGLLSHAMLALKAQMNFPVTDSLSLDTLLPDVRRLPSASVTDAEAVYRKASCFHPLLRQSELEVKVARSQVRSAWSSFLPSLSLSAGVSTSFYKTLGKSYVSFSEQLKAHRGEYISASLSLPIFGQLGRIVRLRKQRNQVRLAEEQLSQRREDLQRLVAEALTACENSCKECLQLERKVAADREAVRLTVRKYEEGIASTVEVQTASLTLMQSRASLLHCRLSQWYNEKMLDYYQGMPLWTR